MVVIGKLIDISNQRFGRWMAIKPSNETGTDRGKKWLCLCDCGTEKYVRGTDLRFGYTKSCGCLKNENIGNRRRTHGMSNTLLYEIWKSMKARCYRKTSKDYPNYGGAGIRVCDEWKEDFIAFHTWAVQNGYKDHLTIERIDPYRNYEPSNCTWIPNDQQALNRRNSRRFEYERKNYSMRELSEKFNINYNTFRAYIGDGKSVEQIIEHFNKTKERL